jgi:hypothetical protein
MSSAGHVALLRAQFLNFRILPRALHGRANEKYQGALAGLQAAWVAWCSERRSGVKG